MPTLAEQFGPIDIYLFDQLLRGNIRPGMRIFDAGCGGGRNLVYFFQQRYDVHGADADPNAIAVIRQLAAHLAPQLPPENFRAEPLESLTFPPASADAVIVSAVLHFARNDAHFNAMLQGAWQILVHGGLFFARLASTIGIESQIKPLGDNRFLLPDGSTRYLVTESRLNELVRSLNAEMLDPLKTTVVQNQRAMTTWVLRKRG